MKVLSLFDGISCLRVALGDRVTSYHASEIDKHAIKIAHKNFPDTKHIGDVKSIKPEDYKDIDLLCGGSPCQDLSISKQGRKGLEGERSGLFWTYLKIKKETNPKWFILENVASMPKKDRDIITREMGVEPIMIDASLVSAQSRKRLFWTNIPVKGLPADKGIKLKDILESDAEVEKSNLTKDGKSFCIDANYHKGSSAEHSAEKGVRTQVKLKQVGYVGNTNSQGNRVYDPDGKSVCLSANGGGRGAKTGLYNLEPAGKKIRKLTPIECERLQCLPDNYTQGISNTQRYRSLGNGFNVEVIKFILTFLVV